MRKALRDVQSGAFAREWMAEYKEGSKNFRRLVEECEALEIEKVGKQVRQMSGLEK
jgi:ketol-acid reductoisomerase